MPAEAIATIIAAVIGLGGVLITMLAQKEKEDRNAKALAGTAQKTALNQIKERGVLKCGSIKHPPLADFSFKNGNCHFDGLYIEMARTVGRNNGLVMDFQAVDWSDLEHSFDSLGLDLVLSVFETKQRMQFADFTAAFHKIGVSGVTRATGSKVETISDLHNHDVRIVVTKGEIGWEYAVRELKIPKYRLIVMENSSLNEMFDYVISGRADVAICDDVTCATCVEQNDSLNHVFLDDSLYLCKNSIMVPKGDQRFAKWVETEFSKALASPDVRALEAEILATMPKLIRRFR
ncbi:substrate-binding periplasmic protein [Microbispora bryophytorum]|uniref:substrate-binding periplasmic protein n=1 Tax=Microbispora bryophytorum TaxID=1460882 RepID=UPI0033F133A6